MGPKTRIALAVVLSAAWSVLVDAAFDRRWPDEDATWWTIYLGGLVVIGAVWMVVDSVARSRREQREQ